MSSPFKDIELERALEKGLVQSIFKPCAEALMEHIRGEPQRVLDVGCGSGIAVRVAKQRFGSITAAHGLDFSPTAIAVAKETATGREFRFWEDNAETFVVDEPYDVIICQHTIQHLDRSEAGMSHMRAALRPGGILILAAWPELEECRAYDFIYTAAGQRKQKAPDVATSIAKLARFATEANFDVTVSELQTTRSARVTPEDLLAQYIASSKGWQGRPAPDPPREKLYADAVRLGWSEANPTFEIGMNVVVARRSS